MRRQIAALIFTAACLTLNSPVLATNRLMSINADDANDPNLVSWWKFDEGSGTIAYDSAGNNDGTLVKGPIWTTGQIGGALEFDGLKNYVSIPHDPALNITGDITIAAWILFERAGVYEGIVTKCVVTSSRNIPYDFRTNTSSEPLLTLVRADAAGNENVYSDMRITLNQWHHVLVRVENKVPDFYVDGILTGKSGTTTFTKTPTGNTRPVLIGRRDDGLYFDGLIDDVRLYNRALSVEEILKIIESSCPNCPAYIWISATEFNFLAYEGGPNPESQILEIAKMGVATLNWTITENCEWLTAEPNSGISTGDVNEVELSVDISSLGVGQYSCQLFVSDPCALNNPQIVDVNLTVIGTMIQLSATEFNFYSLQEAENPPAQMFSVSNNGGGTLNWEITADCNWLSAVPNSGKCTSEVDDVNIVVDISGLDVGRYDCNLTISDPAAVNSPQMVTITLFIYQYVEGALYVPMEYPTIQEAIDIAPNGASIVVAPGTYTGEGNKNLDFRGKAITVRSTDPQDPCVVAATVIDCQNSGRGFYFHNGEGPDSVVRGLTITRGNAAGGGIYCVDSSPTISHCRVINNGASTGVGGIWLSGSGSPKISHCTISGNWVGRGGSGGIYSTASGTLVTHCIITNNSGRGGGGIYCQSNANINNCVIASNHASYSGGGIHCGGGTPRISNCIILYNTLPKNAIHTVSPGITIDNGTATIVNCIIRGNRKLDDPYAPHQILGSATVTYSNFEGAGGGTNIKTDPLLVGPLNGDYHLLPNSPCIDTGDPFYFPLPSETDIDDEPRIMNGRVDMGVDEFTSALIPSIGTLAVEFKFYAYISGSNPEVQILSIYNLAAGTLNWEVIEDCDWLRVEPNSGKCTSEVDDVNILVDISGLDVGRYNCNLTISDPNAVNSPQTVTITLFIYQYVEDALYVPMEYPTIQAAIDDCNNGDLVILLTNTYTGPGNRDIDFKGKAITVRSGDPSEPNIVAATVIDCENISGHRGFYFHSGEGPDSIVSGLTIKRGMITGRPAAGGGIYCGDSSPTIENCIIRHNRATGDEGTCEGIYDGAKACGGGIYCADGSSPIISNCTISNNTLQGGSAGPICIPDVGGLWNGGGAQGGGIYCTAGSNPIISNCTISNNTGQGGNGGTVPESGGTSGGWGKGGGVYCDSGSNPTIENSTISYNILQAGRGGNGIFLDPPGGPGSSCGAGVYCSSDGIAAIDNCIINNNIAIGGPGYYDDMRPIGTPPGDGKGGGVYGQVVISNSLVRENDVRFVFDGVQPWEVFGGGLYCTGSSSITNCLITDHERWVNNTEVTFYGSAIYCDSGSNVTITNSTISNNNYGTAAVYSAGTAQVTITNSILWENLGADVRSHFTVTYSCIEQIVSDIGNIHTNPLFVSGPEGGYYLSQIAAGQVSDSPCVDAGSDTAFNLGMDIYTTRTDEVGDRGIVDMGYHYVLPYSSADIDRNGLVDFFDYAWLSMGLFYETSKQIPRGSVVVDGGLSDWPEESVEWIELDKVYYGNPNDISEARFALQWDANTNKVYAAVVVNDTSHVFSDEYVNWNASDRLEIYSQGNTTGGTGWDRIYDVAQQYCVAPNSTGDCWSTWAMGEALAADAGLEYAVTVDGDQITYEVGIRMFDNYGGFTGGETVITDLSQGHVVGLDLVVPTRRAPDGFGMLAENMITGKSGDAGRFAKYLLVEKIFSADLDRNGSNNYADLGFLFESWLDCYVTEATNPTPVNEARGVDPNGTLSWVPGEGALYHDVYFGTDAGAVANAGHLSPEFMGTVSEALFDPCSLELETTYYWRIDEVGPACTMQGDVWNFTTQIGLISWWKFDEGSGTIAYDSAGTNDGTINGAAWTTGQIGGALDFDGVDDYVLVSDSDSISVGNQDYTICAWIYQKSIHPEPALLTVVSKVKGGADKEYFFSVYNSGLRLDVETNSNNQFAQTTTSPVTVNSWQFIVVAFDSSSTTPTFYHNGQFQPSDNIIDTLPDSLSDDLYIGLLGGVYMSYPFDGMIDDVRIYDRALTAGEILQLYQD